MINNLTKELAESLVEMRNFADIGEIPAAAYMVRADAVLDRYVDALRTPEPKMTINLKDYEGKFVVVTLRNEWRIVSLVYKNGGDEYDYKCFPYSIDGKNYSNDGRVLITAESPYDIIDIKLVDEDPEPVITRVEVITDKREYVNWNPDNKIITSLQDNGKTLKIFVNKVKEDIDIIKECRQTGRTRYTTKKLLDKVFGEQMTEIEEPEMPITKPTSYDGIYTTAERETSKQWANALSVLIEELSPHSSLSLWGYEGKTPTPEKVVECLRGLIKHREQSATDEELEACLGLIAKRYSGCNYEGIDTAKEISTWMRNTRRPQPITLKSQALRDFETVRKHSDLLPEILDTIEKALKSLP
jgi:hypothetical protein